MKHGRSNWLIGRRKLACDAEKKPGADKFGFISGSHQICPLGDAITENSQPPGPAPPRAIRHRAPARRGGAAAPLAPLACGAAADEFDHSAALFTFTADVVDDAIHNAVAVDNVIHNALPANPCGTAKALP
jgi:hypothetical protein